MASHLRYARGRAGAVHDVAAAPGAACALAGAACKTTMYCWIPLASLVRDTLEHATMLRPMHGREDAQRHGSSLAKMAGNVLRLAPCTKWAVRLACDVLYSSGAGVLLGVPGAAVRAVLPPGGAAGPRTQGRRRRGSSAHRQQARSYWR